MEILYTSHAVERMQDRKISSQDVEKIILNPDGKIKQSKDKWIFYKNFEQRTDNLIAIVMVIRSAEKQFEVLTVMVNFEVRI